MKNCVSPNAKIMARKFPSTVLQEQSRLKEMDKLQIDLVVVVINNRSLKIVLPLIHHYQLEMSGPPDARSSIRCSLRITLAKILINSAKN